MDNVISLAEVRAKREEAAKKQPELINTLKEVLVVGQSGGPHLRRVFTQGMERYEMREMFIDNVPIWMHPAAAGILQQAAYAVLNEGLELEDGVLIQLEGMQLPFKVLSVEFNGEAAWEFSDTHLLT